MRANQQFRNVIVLLLGCASVSFAQTGISWAPNVDIAKQTAAQQNQLVLIHFWSTTCAPCMRLEHTVLQDPNVAQALARDYVPVKVNVDDFPAFARELNIKQIPTDVVMTPAGQVLHHSGSPIVANEFVAKFQQIAASARTVPGNAVPQGPFQTASNPTSQNLNSAPVQQPLPAGHPPLNSRLHQQPPPVGHVDQQRGPNGQAAFGAQSPDNIGNQQPNTASRYSSPAGQPPTNQSVSQNLNPNLPPYAGAGQQVTPQQPFSNPNPASTVVAPPQNPQPSSTNLYNSPQGPTPHMAQQATQGALSPPQNEAVRLPNGLDGYCPVTLSEQSRWQPGDTRWGAIHRGRTYLFSGPSEQQRFLANPDFYAPMLSGNDPVVYIQQGQLVTGTRQNGVFYRQQIYLFANENSLRQFWQNPEQFHTAVFQAIRRSDVTTRR